MAKKKSKVPPEVSRYLSELGRKGGSKTGPTKARDSEKMSAAARKRWADARKKDG